MGNLHAKREKYVFLKYKEESKAYGIYDLEAKMILTSRDMVFEE